MCGTKCWLNTKNLLSFLLCVSVLFYINVAEGGSTSKSSTSNHSTDFKLQTLHENVRITAQSIPLRDKNLTWVSQVFSEKLSNYRLKSETNELCNQQSDLYEKSLQNLTLWAAQMREASASSSSGLLVGLRYHMGHFDECVSIRNPSVTGRYCLINIKFEPTSESYAEFDTSELAEENISPYSIAWDAFKKSKHSLHPDKNDIYWGLCVPAACTGQDVEESLRKTFADVQEKNGILVDLKLYDQLCYSRIDEKPLPSATKIIMYVLVFLSALCILATIFHLPTWNLPNLEKRGSFADNVIASFSILTSIGLLTRGVGKINMIFLDALKVYSTLIELVMHRILTISTSMLFNPSSFESEVESDLPLFVPTLILETFITVSGFLTFITCYPSLQKHGIKIMPFMVFYRWLRFMPSYLTYIAFYTFLLPQMGDGPLWTSVTRLTENCKDRWWLNVLGINNIFFNMLGVSCGSHTWYTGFDLQLFLFGLFLVYVFAKNDSVGLKFALISLAVAAAIPFSVIYFNNYNAVYTHHDRSSTSNPNALYYFNVFIPSYMRAGPYIIGIISAYIFFKIRENKWTLSVPSRWLVLTAATGIGIGSQFYGNIFYDKTREYNPLEHALFGAFHRSIWSLMISAFIVIQLAWGFGGNVDKLFTHQIYVFLNRLSYLVYLYHPIWQLVTAASSRTPTFISLWHFIWMIGGDIFVAFGSSLWFFIIIEGPSSKLIGALLRKTTTRGQSENPQVVKKME